MTQSQTEPCLSKKREILAGSSFFILTAFPTMLALWSQTVFAIPGFITGIVIGACIVGCLAAPFVAWYYSFPRWSFPYVGFFLLLSLYWISMKPADKLFALFMWLFIVSMSLYLLISTTSPRPFIRLGKRIWEDWTQVSFAVYGFLPLLLLLAFDEVSSAYSRPYLLAMKAVLILGALGYMIAPRIWQRFLSLLLGSGAVIAINYYVQFTYWDGRQAYWMSTPADGQAIAMHYYNMGVNYLLLLAAPMLLGIAKLGWDFYKKNQVPVSA